MNIHKTAIISEGAQIASDVEIGPYCVIGPNVKIASGVRLLSHICIDGHTFIDQGTKIFPFASIGYIPQDLKYNGEASTVHIGKNCTIREYVTIHPGTKHGIMKTVIGDNCLLMISVHVAHDCVIGNNVIIANNATLAGHVNIGDHTILGGMSAYHQFIRVGSYAIIGGGSMVAEDVIPFGNVKGDRAYLNGINIVGMRRRNFDRNTIGALREAFRRIFLDEDLTFERRVDEISKEYCKNDKVKEMIDFIKVDVNKPMCMPKGRVVL